MFVSLGDLIRVSITADVMAHDPRRLLLTLPWLTFRMPANASQESS